MTLLLHLAHISFLRCFSHTNNTSISGIQQTLRLVQEKNGSLHCDRLRLICKFKRNDKSVSVDRLDSFSVEQAETAKRVQARPVSLHQDITDLSLPDASDLSPEYSTIKLLELPKEVRQKPCHVTDCK
jgi:hypothetical protein